MIVIIDYDGGNTKSVANALKKCNIKFQVTNDHKLIKSAKKIILPGVANFSYCINKLKEKNIDQLLYEEVIQKKKPLLGICSGMQILATKSEEGNSQGLNFIAGKVIKLIPKKTNPVPHMGWNKIDFVQNSDINTGIKNLTRFYFCHSYHFVPDDISNVLMKVNYGNKICCGIKKGNIYGIQFHPEKSQKFGLLIFKNFSENCN